MTNYQDGDRSIPLANIPEGEVEAALEYQKEHPNKRVVDIIHNLKLCDEYALIEALGEILGEKAILLTHSDVGIKVSEYISLDVAKKNKAIPFEIEGNRIKVCFADTSDKTSTDTIRLLLLNKGLIMDRYITFEQNIFDVINSLEGSASDKIDASSDVTGLIDTIIKTAIKKRASDIHIEPEENEVRVRYRIDGELVDAAKISKDKQSQIVGRLKAISNMFQEKQESQDGRIIMYPDYNIRVSSQSNIYGEKFVLRMLKKDSDIKTLADLGFPQNDKLVKDSFNKRNCVTIMAAPTGARENNYFVQHN